jgi:hypothetical protein
MCDGQADDAAAVHPDEGGAEEVPRKLLWQLVAQVVLTILGREKTGASRILENFLQNFINGKFFCL